MKPDIVKKIFTIIIAALFACPAITVATPARAESVVLPPIPLTPSQRGYGKRMHPIKKTMKMHYGQDYPTPTGTNIPYTGVITDCKPNNGSAGNMAIVGNACGVTQVFMHLAHCSKSSITSGNTGGSTGPHLHYEIKINGTAVNPLKAFGKDLCQESVRKELLEDAKNNGVGPGGGGASANSDSPAPKASEQNVNTVYYVPPGTTNPVTGIVNTGPGYYHIETYDGRVITEIEIGSTDVDTPILPPTTDDLVPAGKSDNEITGCATDTWRAMVNQAVLQTRRETMINNRYILKADSVMAYSCFQDSLKKFSEYDGPYFSESKRWVNKQVDISSGEGVGELYPQKVEKQVTLNKELGDMTLDGAILNNADYTFRMHARTNFKHDLLGGLYETSTGGGIDDEDIGQDGLPCGTMAQVWQMAKCLNVDDEPLFPRFEELIEAKSDPRKYPAYSSCNNTGITQKMIDTAKQKKVDNSKLDPYIKMIYPVSGCHPAIKTGVTVERREGAGQISRKVAYEDGTCITTGCSYVRGGTCQ